MRTCLGRSDGKPTNQETAIPQKRIFGRGPSGLDHYYNRLETRSRFYLLYAEEHWRNGQPRSILVPAIGVLVRAFRETAAPWPFLSLPQGRESCDQQVWGVTPFRRGIA